MRLGHEELQDPDEAYKEVELLFGENYLAFEDEQYTIAEQFRWESEHADFASIIESRVKVRNVFNDERRWRNPHYA